jgi:hypothetical protein
MPWSFMAIVAARPGRDSDPALTGARCDPEALSSIPLTASITDVVSLESAGLPCPWETLLIAFHGLNIWEGVR